MYVSGNLKIRYILVGLWHVINCLENVALHTAIVCISNGAIKIDDPKFPTLDKMNVSWPDPNLYGMIDYYITNLVIF